MGTCPSLSPADCCPNMDAMGPGKGRKVKRGHGSSNWREVDFFSRSTIVIQLLIELRGESMQVNPLDRVNRSLALSIYRRDVAVGVLIIVLWAQPHHLAAPWLARWREFFFSKGDGERWQDVLVWTGFSSPILIQYHHDEHLSSHFMLYLSKTNFIDDSSIFSYSFNIFHWPCVDPTTLGVIRPQGYTLIISWNFPLLKCHELLLTPIDILRLFIFSILTLAISMFAVKCRGRCRVSGICGIQVI